LATRTDTGVVLSPRQPLALSGTDIEFNCTLVGFPDNISSASIKFMPPRSPADGGQLVKIIDRLTAKLVYPAVQRKETSGHVFCKVEGHEEYGQVSMKVVGELGQLNVVFTSVDKFTKYLNSFNCMGPTSNEQQMTIK
jgi:hypothetical protein